MSRPPRLVVIGGGVTGLAVGAVSTATVFELADGPGGICRSYYLTPGDAVRADRASPAGEAYRFEVGGGHWIFGEDDAALALLARHCNLQRYERRAVVRLGRLGLTVPYPLQAHVEALGPSVVQAVRREQTRLATDLDGTTTLQEWLRATFGPTLCDLFFLPFHERYTAGLSGSIAPQDGYKSPPPGGRGYNASFRYPVGGLDRLVGRLAEACDVRYGKQVTGIDTESRLLLFADGTETGYDRLVSTLPLGQSAALAGVETGEKPDPYTSVLVLNIGAERGPDCPVAHWQYEPDSRSGFHRIGFYSNVEPDFLPVGRRSGSHVSLYVERAFAGGTAPSATEVGTYVDSVIDELQGRGYIGKTEVLDASWVEVAYTWRLPGSGWREGLIKSLADVGVQQAGRYGRWRFQGIADSVREGTELGEAIRA